MTNRERYDLIRNTYDKMIDILELGFCPIVIMSGGSCLSRYLVCKGLDEGCPACIQRWINEESEV